ncbi:MAG: hypothetical protein JW871_01345 [Endomicrobiales bacterium]|nr:hypothetical protein [Endomicrobiales bacterium]
MRKVKIRGLVRCAARIFLVWGSIVAIKGVWDVFWGEPEANLYSPNKWDFISQKQWLTWSGFEITYGLACVAISYILFKYAWRLPEYIEQSY